ncbi:MAG: winged helix-turn-helix domain-containing protein [Sarcina sp.]
MYSFIDLITEVLNLEKVPLTAEEIWNIGLSRGLVQKVGTKGKTPIKTLNARLYTDMKNNPKSDFIKRKFNISELIALVED